MSQCLKKYNIHASFFALEIYGLKCMSHRNNLSIVFGKLNFSTIYRHVRFHGLSAKIQDDARWDIVADGFCGSGICYMYIKVFNP